MPKILSAIASKISGLFRGRGAKKPPSLESFMPKQAIIGHRGQALRDLKKPDWTPENVRKWRTINREEVRDFVYDKQIFFVHSTNVVAAQYFHETQQMMVEFKGHKSYLYSDVSIPEAISFTMAGSKGGWVWDHLRVRGSKWKHKKPYQRIK